MDKKNRINEIIETEKIIHTPSDFARTSLIYIQEMGETKVLNEHINERTNLDSYLFFIVTDGSGFINFNNSSIKMCKGDCAFIKCRNGYSHYTQLPMLWSFKWIHFFGYNMDNIYNKYISRGGSTVFHPENINNYYKIWNKLYEIICSNDYIKDMKIYENLVCLLTLIMDISWNEQHNKNIFSTKRDISDIKSYIDKHYLDINYSDILSLDSLSKLFFINKYYLIKLFKYQYGMTINNYILNQKITIAKYLLRFTNDTIEIISIKCGISDCNYFSRIFKKIEGISPSQYRNLWIGI